MPQQLPQQLTQQRPDAAADDSAPYPCRLTFHGLRRAAQRNLAPDELRYTLTYGRRVRRTGAVFYFLGARDLPACDCHDAKRTRLIGTVLIVENGALITAYRNPDALRYIKRKLKYRLSAAERAGFADGPYDDDGLAAMLATRTTAAALCQHSGQRG